MSRKRRRICGHPAKAQARRERAQAGRRAIRTAMETLQRLQEIGCVEGWDELEDGTVLIRLPPDYEDRFQRERGRVE
jgi:hypothetical protein